MPATSCTCAPTSSPAQEAEGQWNEGNKGFGECSPVLEADTP